MSASEIQDLVCFQDPVSILISLQNKLLMKYGGKVPFPPSDTQQDISMHPTVPITSIEPRVLHDQDFCNEDILPPKKVAQVLVEMSQNHRTEEKDNIENIKNYSSLSLLLSLCLFERNNQMAMLENYFSVYYPVYKRMEKQVHTLMKLNNLLKGKKV